MVRSIVALALVVAFAGPATAEPAHREETEHFILVWDEEPGRGEVEAIAQAAEEFHTGVSRWLGQEPDWKINIRLGGYAEQPDGSWEYPRVDSWGRVHLFRFDAGHESYLSALAHELVHAFRIARRFEADWFFEEGLAELVALQVDPSLEGFPWYGTPVEVAAGHWVTADQDIPLVELREEHRAWNLPCRLQAYTLRSAFFAWLRESYGDGPLRAMADEEPAGGPGSYEAHLGAGLGELAGRWREGLRARFEATEGAAGIARQWLEESPARYQRICDPAEGP